MNKKVKIAFYKKQAEAARQMQQVAMQNYNLATRLETEAKAALEELGVSKGRAPVGLSEDLKLSLLAQLTK